jgi:hypothetical protein
VSAMVGIALFVFASTYTFNVEPTVTPPGERAFCAHWPPKGIKLCASDADCPGVGTAGQELSCRGCISSSCRCDPVTGGLLACSLDCRTFCQGADGSRPSRQLLLDNTVDETADTADTADTTVADTADTADTTVADTADTADTTVCCLAMTPSCTWCRIQSMLPCL